MFLLIFMNMQMSHLNKIYLIRKVHVLALIWHQYKPFITNNDWVTWVFLLQGSILQKIARLPWKPWNIWKRSRVPGWHPVGLDSGPFPLPISAIKKTIHRNRRCSFAAAGLDERNNMLLSLISSRSMSRKIFILPLSTTIFIAILKYSGSNLPNFKSQ